MLGSNYKIVIIGESMVGKTSILLRYIKGKFIKVEERTINTNCFKKTISINNLIFEINIWDTAGEEKYHAMAPIFYRGADGAVITFDFTRKETFEKAQKWFEELNQFSENNPKIILVGNKHDLDNKCITTDEARNLAKKYNAIFLSVSALTGENVNEIFTSLTYEIYQNKIKINKNQNKIKNKNINIVNDNNDNNNSKKCSC